MKRANLLILIAAVFLALHWVHIAADPTPQLGVHVFDRSGDLYTDEGWDSSGAIAAVRFGHWYLPGQFNLAVDAPVWSAILVVPFKHFGVSAALARSLEAAFFAGAVLSFYFLVKALYPTSEEVAAWTVLILATNYLSFNFSRMSILESIWTFFMVASLLLLTRGLRKTRMTRVVFAILAGILLGIAMITKATAVFGLLPAAIIIVLFCEGGVAPALRTLASYVAGFSLAFGPYALIFRSHFAADDRYYSQVNVSARVVHSLGEWLHSFAAVIAGIRYLGYPMVLAFIVGTVLFLVFKGKGMLEYRKQALPFVFAAWIVGDVLVTSTISYHPARYLLNPLFPVAALTALFLIDPEKQYPKWTRTGTLALLSLLVVAGAFRELGAALHPRYTEQSIARWMAESSGQPSPVVMADCANTMALHGSIRPMDDLLGVLPRPERIRQSNPALYVSLGPVLAERTQDFSAAGRSLILTRTADVLDNYVEGKKLFIYRVVEP